jgi:hypothetical protein
VLVTIVNFVCSDSYHWYEALPLALVIIALLYPVICFAQRHAPMLLGRRG